MKKITLTYRATYSLQEDKGLEHKSNYAAYLQPLCLSTCKMRVRARTSHGEISLRQPTMSRCPKPYRQTIRRRSSYRVQLQRLNRKEAAMLQDSRLKYLRELYTVSSLLQTFNVFRLITLRYTSCHSECTSHPLQPSLHDDQKDRRQARWHWHYPQLHC